MKPLQLKIKGLNSFVSMQTISFENLVRHGIFGIFGSTGSGKSSVLDAITLALYGETARFEGVRSKEFINISGDRCFVSFSFSIQSSSDEVIYRAERNFKRSKTGYEVAACRLVQIQQEQEQVLSDKSKTMTQEIEKIIGLTYSDFTRSVLLPQGKFSKFLFLSGKDRGNMLERIFHLEEYGQQLLEKIRSQYTAEKQKEEVLLSQVQMLDHVSEEGIVLKKQHAAQLAEELSQLKTKIEQLSQQWQTAQEQLVLAQSYEKAQEEKRQLDAQKTEMESLSTQLQMAKSAFLVLPYIEKADAAAQSYKESLQKYQQAQQEKTLAEENHEKAKADWEQFKEKKEKAFPRFVEQEVQLKEAVSLDDSNRSLLEEREALKIAYKEKQSALNRIKQAYNTLTDQKSQQESFLADIEKKKSAAHIQPAYKDQIQKGLMQEVEFQKAQMQVQERKTEFDQSQSALALATDQYAGFKDEMKLAQDKFEQLVQEEKKLQEKAPGSDEDLFRMQEEFREYAIQLAMWEEQEKKVEEETVKQQESLKEIEELDQMITALETRHSEVLVALKKIESLLHTQLEQNNLSALADKLSPDQPCPLCGSLHHPDPFSPFIEVGAELEEERDLLQLEKQGSESQVQEFLLKKERWLHQKEESQKALDLLESKKMDRPLSSITQKQILNLQKNLETHRKALEENALESEQQRRLVAESERNCIKWGETCFQKKKQVETLQREYEQALQKSDQLGLLYRKQQNEAGVENFQEAWDQLLKMETQKQEWENKEKTVRKELEQVRRQREELQEKVQELQRDLNEIAAIGKEKTNLYDRQKERVRQIAGEEDPNKALSRISQLLRELEQQGTEKKEMLSSLESRLEKIREGFVLLQKETERLCTLSENEQKNALEQMKACGFQDRQEVEKHCAEETILAQWQQKLQQYEHKTIENAAKLADLQHQIQIPVTEQEVHDLHKALDDCGQVREQNIRNLAVLNQAVQTDSENLKILTGLQEELKKVSRQKDLLADLSDVMKGNRFVQHMAAHHLQYVTLEASQRLKEMTNGRYAIEMAEGEFVIRDDFGGGQRRGVSTLSGGEVFLVSFCLALALSSKIQMKNRAPLEFFFLDEGFGSLDADLLDIVIESLEHMQKNNLCIGVISHVEELKNRVPAKIMIEPHADEWGGSKISSYIL